MKIWLPISVLVSLFYSTTSQCGTYSVSPGSVFFRLTWINTGCIKSSFCFLAGSFSFASYYADHMVLQQSPASPIIWGYANSVGLPITVSMSGVNYDATSFEGKREDIASLLFRKLSIFFVLSLVLGYK